MKQTIEQRRASNAVKLEQDRQRMERVEIARKMLILTQLTVVLNNLPKQVVVKLAETVGIVTKRIKQSALVSELKQHLASTQVTATFSITGEKVKQAELSFNDKKSKWEVRVNE